MNQYQTFPKDILKIILFKLNIKEISYLCTTCTTNRILNKLNKDENFWKEYIQQKDTFKEILQLLYGDQINENKMIKVLRYDINRKILFKNLVPKNKCCATFLEGSKLIKMIVVNNHDNCLLPGFISRYNILSNILTNKTQLYGNDFLITTKGNKYLIRTFDNNGIIKEEKEINGNDELKDIKFRDLSIYEYINTRIII